MADRNQRGRSADDVDALKKALRPFVVDDRSPQHANSAETDRMGREQQRRATAYARARGQL
jgi:hypothetical protein